MNTSSQVLNVTKQLSSSNVSQYLQSSGWRQEKEIENKASIWVKEVTLNTVKGNIEIFLPLQSQAPDFSRRMLEVLETLELVEERPKKEILYDLLTANQIAERIGREVLNIKLSFLDRNQKEAPIKNLGEILETLQNVINAIGQAKDGIPTSKGAISKKILDQTKLFAFGSFTGSFGIRTAVAQAPSQLDFFKQPLAADTIDEFLNLVKDSSDPEKLHARLNQLKKRSASSYLKFLRSLVSAESDLYLNWGSINSERGGFAELSLMTARVAIDIVTKVEMESPEIYEVIGEWIGGNKRRQDFEMTDLEGERYTGKISDTVLRGATPMIIGQIYSATIEETIRITPVTNEGVPEYRLVNLRLLGAEDGEISPR